ncbi:TetR/AcrR family transcriptional regulator [Nocardia sp. NPDC005366]|uniref:TetR/AcrR family transcriptional regulator n=1 Tax=Nocardia sp. NPDC005366 TaxID=3156878 RepID=UPI0033AF9726
MTDRVAPTRKTPSQTRSREMVQRIIDAGEAVLTESGYAATSTNRVAERAGISKGSLYQYFPDKNAIVVAVLNRFCEQMGVRMVEMLEPSLDLPPLEVLHISVTAMIDIEITHLPLLRVIVEQVPSVGVLDALEEQLQRLKDICSAWLEANRAQLRPDLDTTSASWLMVETAAQLSFRYVSRNTPFTREQFVAMLVDQLGRCILA